MADTRKQGIGFTFRIPVQPLPLPLTEAQIAALYAGYVWVDEEEDWYFMEGQPFTPYPGWPAPRSQPQLSTS